MNTDATPAGIIEVKGTDPGAEHVVAGLDLLDMDLGRFGRVTSDMFLNSAVRCIMQTRVDRPELLTQSQAFLDACYRVADVGNIDRKLVDAAIVESIRMAEIYVDRDPKTGTTYVRNVRTVEQAFAQVRHRHQVEQARRNVASVAEAYDRQAVGPGELGRAYTALDAAMRSGGARRPATADELATAVWDARQRYRERSTRHIGLDTPTLPSLSEALCGWRGLLFLTAMPGIGKTTLLMQAGLDAIRELRDREGNVVSTPDACLVFLSLEMTPQTIMERMMAQVARMTDRRLMLEDQEQDEQRRMLAAHQELAALGSRLRIFGMQDVGMMGGTADPVDALDDLVGIVEQAKSDAGVSRAFVVVDSMQRLLHRMKPPPNVRGAWDANERDGYVTTALMAAWHRLGVDDPVAVVAHTRKTGFRTPNMEDVRGSGDIVYGGECVLTMYRPEDSSGPDDPAVVVDVEKGRDMMRRGPIRMRFKHEMSLFEEDRR